MVNDARFLNEKAMYEFTSGELDTLLGAIREMSNDVACLDCWCDALEYDVKNYIGEKPFTAFAGFIRALEQHLSTMRGICFSKEYILDL